MNRRWLRRIGLAALLFGAGSGALVVGGVIFLTTETGNELVRRQILRLAGPLVPGGRLELDHLRFNLVDHLEVEGVRLLDPAGAPVVGLERLSVDYDLREILDSKVTIHHLDVQAPTANLSADDQGGLNVLTVLGVEPSPPSTEPPTPWGGIPAVLEIEAVNVKGGALRYQDGATVLRLDALELALAATVDHADVSVRDLHLSAALHEPAELPLRLDGGLLLTDDTLRLDGLQAGLGGTTLALDGGVAHAQTAPSLNLKATAHATAADVAALAGESVLKQDLDATLDLDGPLSALIIEGALQAPAGELALKTQLNLEVDPLAWQVQLGTGGLDLDALLVAVTEPTHLDGRYELTGTGTGWPEAPGQDGPELIRGTVHITGGDQVLWGEPLRRLTLDARIEAGRVEIERLSGDAAVADARLKGTVDVPAGRADLSGEVKLGDLSALSRYGVTGLAGSATWSGKTSVRWSEPEIHVQADGTVTGTALSLPGDVQLAEVSAPLDLTVDGEAVRGDGELALKGLSTPDATLEQASGAWTVDRAADGTLSLGLTALSVAGLAAPEAGVSLGSAAGTGEVHLDAAGRPALALNLDLTDLSLPTGARASGPVSATLEGDAVTAQLGLANGPAPVLVASAKGDLGTGAWELRDLALGLTPDALWRAPEPVRFTVAEDGLAGVALALESQVGAISAQGDLRMGAPAARIDLTDLDLAWVSAQARRADASDPLKGLAGKANASVQLAGSSKAPEGVAQVSLAGLVFPGAVEAPIDLQTQLGLTDGVLRVEGGVDHAAERWLSLGGDVPLNIDLTAGTLEPRCASPIALRAIAGPLSAERLAEVAPAAKGAFEQLSADLRVSGDICDPAIGLTVASTTRAADPERVLRADLELVREGAELRTRGGVTLDGARRVQIDGDAKTEVSQVFAYMMKGAPEPDLSAPGTWLSALELDAVPLAVPLSVVGAPSSISGTLVGGLQVSGELDDLQLAGGLQWMDGKLGGVALNLGYFGIEPADGGYALTALMGFPEGGGLELTGFIPMRIDVAGDLEAGIDSALSDNRLRLNISDGNGGPARLPLEALVAGQAGFSEAKGEIELSGEVTGSLNAPEPNIELGLYGGAITLADTDVRYDEITLNASVQKDAVRLRDLSVRTRPRFGAVLRPGQLTGSGEIALEGLAPQQFSVDLHMDDFWASATPDTSLALNGDLDIRGPWPELTLSGDLTLGQTRIAQSRDAFLDNASFTLNPDIQVSREGVVGARSLGEVPSVWEGFPLDLTLNLNRNLNVRVEMPTSTDYGKQVAQLSGVNLDADLDGELKVTGTAGAPVVRGVIETVSGSVLLLAKKFELAPEGEISFAGGDYEDPILKLEATQSTEYGDVHAYITRHVSDINVEFKADDYPDPADATALILFGRPGSELTDAQGGSNLAALALASLSGEIERAVGLSAIDQFEIDPTSSAVRVGKALSDNLFLTLQFQQVGTDTSENAAQATVEWTIRRKLTAEFVTGDAGKSSADLYWRWRF